ncbi:GMC oxidoreductase [Chelatococcus asaccharovorans]|uniref:GMC oxidoreductase n=1 Tax=Chelatococcus asaccharovorans TaxID=28210 RepID=UPI00224C6713|nr:GMC family oxidoreductase [Chelatococcus asaccharovorans]CAH1660960.1 Cholesterol oxidase [Chelatococcus asaccharovorans]CAH1690128.1 Cholesterol oxidase [Chelatococcus asaccharovorans]
MASFDYDVIIIGSGFGGSVAALRAVEKGYSVAVLEAGRRWSDADLPKTSWDLPKFAWEPELELFGIQRIRYLDDVIVLSGSGVGGGSLVYANTLYVPAQKFFDYPTWSHITDWAEELAPYYDLCNRMFGVQVSPYMETDSDRIMREVAADMKRPYLRAPLGIHFGTPGVEADDPYFGGVGPKRTGCISCNDCMIGCPHGAKNKTPTNYLYLAENRGAAVHELKEVHELIPLEDGGFEVVARHPGPLGFVRAHHHYKARQVIVSAHAFGTAQLLLSMKHKGTLDKLSDEAGKRARTNSEALVSVQRSEADYRRDPEKFRITPGAASVTACLQIDPEATIGPVRYGVGSNAMSLLYTAQPEGNGEHHFRAWLKQLIEHPIETISIDYPREWSQRGFNLLCMRDHDDWLDLSWKHGMLHSKPGSDTAPPAIVEAAVDVGRRVAEKLGGVSAQTFFSVVGKSTSAHFIGGQTIGEDAEHGVVDPYQRVFGYPGLHIMDGSVITANPGVNPSHTIAALAERAMSFWPHKGEADPRPPLGSGYERVQPVMPRNPVVPAEAPGGYRLNHDLSITDVVIGDQPQDR